MDKGSGDEHTSTKVLAEEEDLWWDLHPLDLLCHYWETSTEDGSNEHNDLERVSDVPSDCLVCTYKLQQRAEESRKQQHPPHCHTAVSPCRPLRITKWVNVWFKECTE